VQTAVNSVNCSLGTDC